MSNAQFIDQQRESKAGSPPSLVVDGAIATVTLRRPGRANRIEPDDLGILTGHLRTLESSPHIRAVIFTATGEYFSAGYDISSIIATVSVSPDGTMVNPFGTLVDAIEALPQTTICALNGGVFGGAIDLALACDYRLGVTSARMFVPAARFGLHYYTSGLRRYITRLGLGAAKRLFLLADEMDAQQMLAIGYLDELVPGESLQSRAQEVAARAAGMGPLAASSMKAALNSLADGTADLTKIAAAELACLRSDDLREGVAAWREKRSPIFHGK